MPFADARTNDSVDDKLDNIERDKEFDVPAGESMSLAWRLSVPDGLGFLTYKAVGSTGRLSDGEEGFLPVLSRQVLVTESLPLPIRGKQSKQFEFTKLGFRQYKDIIIRKTDPRGKSYYWIGGRPKWKMTQGSDFETISRGIISITPLKLNFTDQETLSNVAQLNFKI